MKTIYDRCEPSRNHLGILYVWAYIYIFIHILRFDIKGIYMYMYSKSNIQLLPQILHSNISIYTPSENTSKKEYGLFGYIQFIRDITCLPKPHPDKGRCVNFNLYILLKVYLKTIVSYLLIN